MESNIAIQKAFVYQKFFIRKCVYRGRQLLHVIDLSINGLELTFFFANFEIISITIHVNKNKKC